MLVVALLLALAAGGCSSTKYVTARKTGHGPFDAITLGGETLQPTTRTMQVLRSYDLLEQLDKPAELLPALQRVVEADPSAEKIYAYAELNYRAGRQAEGKNPQLALKYFGVGVAYAYRYLFDEKFAYLRNPYDPQFRGACDLYNGSLESGLRIVSRNQALRPGQKLEIKTEAESFEVEVVLRGTRWHEEDFDRFEFVSDYEVQGLTNQYQTFGLGVPLIAIQKRHENYEAAERYYPPGLTFPVTAFLRLMPEQDGSHRRKCVLELHDPLAATDVEVCSRVVPLESDLSTPLAYFLQNASTQTEGKQVTLEQLSTLALLRPDKTAAIRGLYMLQPYEPNKIPVILVHGLWSSPLTWTEMFNDLRGNPQIRNQFQFWFYFYPTGQPFWTSATQFRQDLAAMREQLDPGHQQPALDQAVLIGHSMGGLVSRMQTISSGNNFWGIASDQSFDNLKADDATKAQLRQMFFFEPNPSIKRVITMGTPHRGSAFSSNTVQYIGRKLISLPDKMFREEVVKNNPGLFKDTYLVDDRTSLDSLSPECPIFPVMLSAQKAPWVTYHNVVGVVPDKGFYGSLTNKVQSNSDGVVAFTSAHMEDVASEIVVPADHMTVHSHPRSVLEVRRILLEHLSQVQTQLPQPVQPPRNVYTAAE